MSTLAHPVPTTAALPSLPATHQPGPVILPADPKGLLRRFLAFCGPGFLIAVGYMDPGNWATSIAGGSQFGYSLLCVIFLSNLTAMGFQAAAVRLGIGAGLDLAQACRVHFPPRVNLVLWAMCEIAIAACNLAEVIGTAIGLNLLVGLPLVWGVVLTIIDVMIILMLQSVGFRYLEAFVAALVAIVAISFAIQIWILQPALASVLGGLVPDTQIVTNPHMLYLAIGIVGATIMPHNLYLHSAIVQTRRHDDTVRGKSQAITFATIDGTIALALAFLVSAAILVVAATAFHAQGSGAVDDLGAAYQLLSPLLGAGLASALFGVALLASGLSASVTGTLAGQIVMEGFLQLRLSPVRRRLVTRAVAILPALGATAWYGAEGANALLVLSQVVLSLQLPFAIVPLLMFTTSRRYLGPLAFRPVSATLLWSAALILVGLNVWMVGRAVLD